MTIQGTAQAAGISLFELGWILEREVEASLLAQGRVAAARVWFDPSDSAPLCRIDDAAEGCWQGPVHRYLAPERLQACLHDRAAARIERPRWTLAIARCVAVHEHFSEVILHDADRPAGPHASGVLAHSGRAVRDLEIWPPPGQLYVAARPSRSADNEPHGLPWEASRSHSTFLRLLCRHFLGVDLAAELYQGTGMVIAAPHGDLGSLIGPAGRTLRALEAVAGLRKLYVVRRPALPAGADTSSLPVQERRLRSAIKSFGIRAFHLSQPDTSDRRWAIHIDASAGKHLRGVGGTKLLFISRLAEVPVRVVELGHAVAALRGGRT